MKTAVRLSKEVLPIHYKLHLQPDLKKFTFAGEEEILIEIKETTNEITLHSKELEILTAEYIFENEHLVGKIKLNPKDQTATFLFAKNLPKGQGILSLQFKGILTDKLQGFYRSKYLVKGEEKYMATTQFESTDARAAFPCFDEPGKKAIFEVSLTVPNDLIAISNTIEKLVEDQKDGWKRIEFEPTPKMSTYLLAFIIGEFESVEDHSKNGVKVRVFVTPGKKRQATFALETATKILDYFEKYFDIPYPLPVLDLIAIADFSAGAMENWGAITYREEALLIDPEKSGIANKQRVATVISHELVHQWFGNLVTMDWWTYLWLNESFAGYMEYIGVDYLFPEWDMWTQFLYFDHNLALGADALENTHQIEMEVSDPDEISEFFDPPITYSKGASILRMLANFLGEKNFRDGLRLYLKTHAYSNATTEDLWAALEKVSGQPVGKMMHNWVRQPGYPLLKVETKGDKLAVSQSRFFGSDKALMKSTDKTQWQIPLAVLNQGQKKEEQFFMDKKSLELPKAKGWTKLNFGEQSLVRVDYPKEGWQALKEPVEKKQLGPIDRLGLIRDAFDLSQTGILETEQALNFALSFKGEDNFTVWSEALSNIVKVYSLIEDTNLVDDYKKYGREVLSQIAAQVGWEKQKGESHSASLLRSLILRNYGRFGDEQTIKKAFELFEKSYKRQINLDPDIKSLIYMLVAENGDETHYQKFMELYLQTDLQEEKTRFSNAFGLFKDPKLIKNTLKFAFSKDVRSSDAFRVVHFVFANKDGKDIAWKYVQDNWPKILKTFKGGHLLPRFITPAIVFNYADKAKEVKDFFKKNDAPGGERTVKQTVEQIESNAAWLKRDQKGMANFLKQFNS